MATHSGTIKFYKSDRGFGFITSDDGAPDVFVHIKNWLPQGSVPVDGQKVDFDIAIDKSKGKPHAVNVRAAA